MTRTTKGSRTAACPAGRAIGKACDRQRKSPGWGTGLPPTAAAVSAMAEGRAKFSEIK
jgi:hypothetical protein